MTGDTIEKEISRVLLESSFQELEYQRVWDDWKMSRALQSVVFCGPYRESLELGALFPPSMIRRDSLITNRVGGWVLEEDAVAYLNHWLEKLSPREAWYELHMEEQSINGSGADGIRLQLTDKKREMAVSFHEIGSGISQMFPILLTAVGYKNSLVCIKQPELHLHPAIQADLADVFIENRDRNNDQSEGNRYLIETHSEHLLLRILRRIRQTRKGEAEPGKSISADDVAVLYVENRGDHSIVRNMPISPDGELLHDWPGGFLKRVCEKCSTDAQRIHRHSGCAA